MEKGVVLELRESAPLQKPPAWADRTSWGVPWSLDEPTFRIGSDRAYFGWPALTRLTDCLDDSIRSNAHERALNRSLASLRVCLVADWQFETHASLPLRRRLFVLLFAIGTSASRERCSPACFLIALDLASGSLSNLSHLRNCSQTHESEHGLEVHETFAAVLTSGLGALVRP